MGILAGRRDELGRARTQVTGRLHRLLLELLPGRARKFLSARQARAMIATVKPRDLAGKTRRRLAVELTGEPEAGGMPSMMAMRALKRRLQRGLLAHAGRPETTRSEPGRATGDAC